MPCATVPDAATVTVEEVPVTDAGLNVTVRPAGVLMDASDTAPVNGAVRAIVSVRVELPLGETETVELPELKVNPPGEEQKATWLQVRRVNPHWIFLSGWGVMNQVSIKEAVATGYPMDHFIGNWWSSSDADVIPAGSGARGFIGAAFHAAGTGFKVHQDIFKYVYDRGNGAGKREAVGEVLYNRGLISAMFEMEAIRTAMAKYGNRPPTGEQVRWGFENLHLTERRLDELGMKGFAHPITITCEDHEGAGPVMFQQWDGKRWNRISDWIPPMRDVVRPKLEAVAAEQGRTLGYVMRDCSKEQGRP